MNFFVRRSNITIDCFTSDITIFNVARPDYAARFIPDWWKKVPNYYNEKDSLFQSPTIKKCEAFKGMFTHGLILPLWSDLILDVGKKGTNYYGWQFSDRKSNMVIHPFAQMNNYLDEQNIQHFKLTCPWTFRCKDDTKWAWVDPVWTNVQSNDYVILPGIVSFKIALQGNVNLFVYREENPKIIKINFGRPLAQFVPMTEKKLKIKHHLVTEQEYENLSFLKSPIVFYNRYNTLKKLLKRK